MAPTGNAPMMTIQANRQFRVNNGSLILRGGKLVLPGTVVSESDITPASLKDGKLTGLLVEVGAPDPVIVEEEIPIIKPDTKVEITGQPKNEEGLANVKAGVVASNTNGAPQNAVTTQIITPPAPAAPVGEVVMTPKWGFNPAVLLTKPLVELNAMIIERDNAVAPFQTKEEAVAFLSQEYK